MTPIRWAACVALFGFGIHAAIFFPGWLSFDSAYQLWQARQAHFNNLSPVPMTLALAGLVRLFHTESATPLFLCHLLLFWSGLACWVRIFLPSWKGLVLTIGVFGFITPLWWTLANVWTDTAMLASYTAGAGFALLGHRLSLRWLHWLALVVLLYGSMVRLNAIFAAIPLFALWWICRTGRDRQLRFGATKVALSIAALSAVTGLAIDRVVADERVRTWPVQVLHDLAAISINTNEHYIPAFARPPDLTIATLKAAYTPYVAVPILLSTPPLRSGLVGEPFSDEESVALGKAWLTAIASEPIAYAQHRSALLGKLLVWPDQTNSYAMGSTSVNYRDNPSNGELTGFARAIVDSLGSIVWRFQFSFLPYAILLIVVAYRLWRDRRKKRAADSALIRQTAGLLLASACFHIAPLIIFAPGADARYIAWPVAAILLGAISLRREEYS